MDKVEQVDRDAAKGHHGQFCNAFGPTPLCCSCGIEKAFARHRIAARKQALEEAAMWRKQP